MPRRRQLGPTISWLAREASVAKWKSADGRFESGLRARLEERARKLSLN